MTRWFCLLKTRTLRWKKNIYIYIYSHRGSLSRYRLFTLNLLAVPPVCFRRTFFRLIAPNLSNWSNSITVWGSQLVCTPRNTLTRSDVSFSTLHNYISLYGISVKYCLLRTESLDEIVYFQLPRCLKDFISLHRAKISDLARNKFQDYQTFYFRSFGKPTLIGTVNVHANAYPRRTKFIVEICLRDYKNL